MHWQLSLFSDIRKFSYWYKKNANYFLVTENHFRTSKKEYLMSEFYFWYQKFRFFDIGIYKGFSDQEFRFLISKNGIYDIKKSKMFHDIRKWLGIVLIFFRNFLILKIFFDIKKYIFDNRYSNFWYQIITFFSYFNFFSDIRKSFSNIKNANIWYQNIIFWYQKIYWIFLYQKI